VRSGITRLSSSPSTEIGHCFNTDMVDTIYILRHGYRLNWVTATWKSVTGLPRDPPLAAFGISQAQETAEYLKSLPEEERPTAIFSSPYYRCLQTTQPIAVALGIPIYVEHGLAEWYSPVEPGSGLHPRPASATNLRQYFDAIDDSWSSIYYSSRKGEDVEACHNRVGGCLEALIPEINRRFCGKHKRILLASHAATIIAMIHELLGDRKMPLRVGCCTLSELKRKEGAEKVVGGWEAEYLADGKHMKEGATRDWGFEDIVVADGQVVNDKGQPGTEGDDEGPVGLQLSRELTARM